ncbi:MAG TPA: DHHA1 domain-containing protein, partial [Gaiellaceae bacterium]|nr:DHHA1 domain-containing protein [Gaiellaceae bacterium]
MRAETVIATHGNTDFDALASMLAARRLYPDAVVCLSGALNRNVREFYRLHADELDLVEVARLELDAIRRLIVVETVHAARLDQLESVARDPAVEKVVFDHHGELPDWAPAEAVVLSDDASLTTTLVGILAERELPVTPLEATVFALGIHEDTGSLTFPDATTRDAEAIAWCLRHGASQELVADYLHTPLSPDERELLAALMDSLETQVVAGVEALFATVRWRAVDVSVSHLASKLVELTDAKALVALVEMGDRVFAVTRSRTPELDASALAAALGGGGHAQAASASFKGSLDEARTLLLEGFEPAT